MPEPISSGRAGTLRVLRPVPSEPAAHLINDENGGKGAAGRKRLQRIPEPAENIGHSVGFELKAGPVSRSYEEAEIEAFIKEVNEQFAMIADTHELMTLTDNDEIALEKVRSYGFEAMHECQYISFGMGRLPAESFKKLSLIERRTSSLRSCIKAASTSGSCMRRPTPSLKKAENVWKACSLRKFQFRASTERKSWNSIRKS